MISLDPIPGQKGVRRTSSILGRDGQPQGYFLYPSPRWNLRSYKPRYWLGADTKTNVSEYDRWELVNYSRQLYAQIGYLFSAVGQKNSWAFGDAWDAHYMGRNKAWGQRAQEFLKYQFYPMANVRGPQYDLKASLRISGQMWDVDGDDAMLLTQSEKGFPQLAFLPSTRIGMQATGARGPAVTKPGGSTMGTVNGGPYDGAKIFDGVIYNRNNRMIALRLSTEDGNIQDVSSYNCEIAYEPDWHDQGRGIPRIAVSLLRWMNVQDIDEFIQRGMKRAASIGLKVKTVDGEAGMGNEVITQEADPNAPAGSNAQVAYEEIEGGEMWYLRAGQGEDIDAVNYANPHPNSEAFIARIIHEAICSVGWLYELLDVGKTGRAPTRLACDVGNQHIWARQATGYRRWKRAISYAIAKAMKEGLLPRNEDGMDPYLWEPGLPKQLSVDAGNEEQADRENLKLGTTSKSIIAQKKGYHRQEIEAQRMQEIRDLVAMAKQINQESPEVPFEKAMELLEQRSPNPLPMAPAGRPEPAGEEKED